MVVHENTKHDRVNKEKLSETKEPKFTSGRDVQTLLRSGSQNIASDGLRALRNQISLKQGEDTIPVQDDRLLLVKDWLEASPSAQDVFGLLERGPQPAIAALCVSILSCVLALTSQHFVYQPLGQPIIKKLLTSQWLRKINTNLSSAHSDLCMATLKLLNSISNFAGGKEQKSLLEAFSWDVKVFHKLLYMRRKGKGTEPDILARPDIRTLCLQFILSFVSSSSHIKTLFLEQHRDVFLSIFKGLSMDPHSVVRYILEVLWKDLWQAPKVKRTLKIGLFGETTVQHLLKLYERSTQEGSDPEHVTADIVHHFLLAICTHRGVGICFADNGWYPRHDDDSEATHKSGKFYNKILANTLKMLKVNDDARQQELALKILHACPELVSGYLQSAGLTLEPRLSSKWLANIAFVSTVVSLPVPTESFYLPTGTAGSSSTPAQYAYQPSPPPLATIIENIIPSANLKIHISKALQAPSALVQHAAGLALAQCLRKCEEVRDAFRAVEQALEEDEIEGQWTKRRVEVEREVRKRVPEFQVIIAFSNAHRAGGGTGQAPQIARLAMLSELSQRLLWLYHRCVPSLVAEARYDVGKSLQNFLDYETQSADIPTDIQGLDQLQQLHVLRMLKESDQFVWSGKAAPSTPSNVFILLKLFNKTKHGAIREALTSLLTQALKDSLLFQHDPAELQLWLEALPQSVRSPGVEAPDGTPLTDEREVVIGFLDECMQRCAKTPHRYLEDIDALLQSSLPSAEGPTDASHFTNISPVMMTVLEQLGAKMRSALLSPSDALALTTYIRKVTVNLLGKQFDALPFKAIATRLTATMTEERVFAMNPIITSALKKEIRILEACISLNSPDILEDRTELSPPEIVYQFVSQIEYLEYPDSDSAAAQAYELIDWLRLVNQPLNAELIDRLVVVLKRLYPPALADFYLYLNPGSGFLWSVKGDDFAARVSIEWLLLHTPSESFGLPDCTRILNEVLQRGRRSLHAYKSISGTLLHRLCVQTRSGYNDCVLNALSIVAARAKKDLTSQDFSAFKNFVILERPNIKLLSCESDVSNPVVTALGRLMDIILDHTEDADRSLVSSICEHWIALMRGRTDLFSGFDFSRVLPWIKLMTFEGLLGVTEHVLRSVQSRQENDAAMLDNEALQLIEELLLSLVRHEGKLLSGWLNEHLSAFLSLRELLPTLKVLERVIARSVGVGIPLGCDGFHTSNGELLLRAAADAAGMHWTSRSVSLPPNASVHSLLVRKQWSEDISSAVMSFVYRSPEAQDLFWSWLTSEDLSRKSAMDCLAPAIHGFLDSNGGKALSASNGDVVKALLESIARDFFLRSGGRRVSRTLSKCLLLIMEDRPQQRKDFFAILLDSTSYLSVYSLHHDAVRMALILKQTHAKEAGPVSEAIFNHALQWAVRYLSDSTESVDDSSLNELADVLRQSKNVAPHFAEPVVAAAIRHHLLHAPVVQLADVLLSHADFKPAVINRHLQSILQHVQFNQICAYDTSAEEKQAVVKLLYTMFHTHPTNTCQPSHVQPLIQLYSGSLSSTDRQLLAIFHLFETQRRSSVASIFIHWCQPDPTSQRTSLDVILNLDAHRVLRTCLAFPDRRTAAVGSEQEVKASRAEDALVYDPVFVLLLFSQVLVDGPPQTALSWVSLYRTNAISLVIRCLSSADSAIRQLALSQLSILWKTMQTADMQEKEHVIHLLDLLRDRLPEASENSDIPNTPRLTSYGTLLVAHALRGIFYPSNFIYPITARFLLQRPELDLQDVPMLYGLLYSSSDEWKKERGWMVKFLADGMSSSEDWRLLKRRHTWDLLASLFQGSYNDRPLRHGILEVLANLTCHTQATTSLVLKSSLLQWIEMQLLTVKNDENVAWARIIENVLVVVDTEKIEQATNGEWQAVLLRCLTSLLRDADITLLHLLTRSMTRLNSERLGHSSIVRRALELAIARLTEYEKNSTLGLHQLPSEDNLETWGKVVESLWVVSMTHEVKGVVWDQLTSRLLLWRANRGESESSIGEWARKQVVAMLREEGNR
ncbi:hypothetical protein M0805_005637 [Coniferiporia weirii]|nr:hypothetical protein M0805_005637 [Coniferiporia weirii]